MQALVPRVAFPFLGEAGVHVIGIDADGRNPHLLRFYSASIKVSCLDVRTRNGWSNLIDGMSKLDPETGILIDLPANIGAEVADELPRFQEACA